MWWTSEGKETKQLYYEMSIQQCTFNFQCDDDDVMSIELTGVLRVLSIRRLDSFTSVYLRMDTQLRVIFVIVLLACSFVKEKFERRYSHE